MRTLILLLLFPGWLLGQYSGLPFELERNETAYYDEVLDDLSNDFQSESDALSYYLTAYKKQRANNPAAYFIGSNESRNLAAEFIKANYSAGGSMALIGFLESEGSLASCAQLISIESEFVELLPYQYLAATILKQDNKALVYLSDMSKHHMISEVMVAFGNNARISMKQSDIVVTQGLQDLIGIRFALYEAGEEIEIRNFLVESTRAFEGQRINELLESTNKSIWISPTVSTSFYERYINQLWMAGIGLKFQNGPSLNPAEPKELIRGVGTNFYGLKSKPKTPADFGLISAYKPFAKQFFELSQREQSENLSSKAKKIMKYTDKK